jgi:hypothetical protein
MTAVAMVTMDALFPQEKFHKRVWVEVTGGTSVDNVDVSFFLVLTSKLKLPLKLALTSNNSVAPVKTESNDPLVPLTVESKLLLHWMLGDHELEFNSIESCDH